MDSREEEGKIYGEGKGEKEALAIGVGKLDDLLISAAVHTTRGTVGILVVVVVAGGSIGTKRVLCGVE